MKPIYNSRGVRVPGMFETGGPIKDWFAARKKNKKSKSMNPTVNQKRCRQAKWHKQNGRVIDGCKLRNI